MTNEQSQALKAQMKRKRRDWTSGVMRTCDYCGQHKYTLTQDDGSAICAPCCDTEHVANLENIAETLLAERDADKALIAKAQADATQWKELVDAFCSDEVEWHKLTNSNNELTSFLSTLICKQADRIAELEARTLTVKLPERYSMLHRTDFHEPYHTEMVFKAQDVINVLSAAGITLVVGE